MLEVCLPGICGYEVCRELRESFGDGLWIIFISGTRTESYDRVGGLLLGADAYLNKPLAIEELTARIRGLLRRDSKPKGGVTSRLSPREHEVMHLMVEGLAHKEIANRLSISPRTIGTHVEHIFTKLGVHTRAQAVRVYQDDLGRGDTVPHLILPFLLYGNDFCEWASAGALLAG